MTDICCGVGGYGVLFAAVQSLVEPGDEVKLMLKFQSDVNKVINEIND